MRSALVALIVLIGTIPANAEQADSRSTDPEQQAIMRTLLVIVAFLAPVPAFAQSTCPTTASSDHQQFIPPAPYRAVLERGRFWYGSEKLWTALSQDGHWGGAYRADLKVYRNKLGLNRVGFDWRREHTPPVVVTAKRINQRTNVGAIIGDTAHGVSDDTNSYIMTALDLPIGCWQINAQYGNEPPLTFVLSVP